MKSILVLCTGNSCRSQMAEAYLRHFAGHRAAVYSAGLEAHGLNPRAMQVLQEDGLDVSGHRSETVGAYAGRAFDLVVTVCDHAREHCPYFPAPQVLHHSFPDPARATGTDAEVLEQFRAVREAIKAWSRQLVAEHL